MIMMDDGTNEIQHCVRITMSNLGGIDFCVANLI